MLLNISTIHELYHPSFTHGEPKKVYNSRHFTFDHPLSTMECNQSVKKYTYYSDNQKKTPNNLVDGSCMFVFLSVCLCCVFVIDVCKSRAVHCQSIFFLYTYYVVCVCMCVCACMYRWVSHIITSSLHLNWRLSFIK